MKHLNGIKNENGAEIRELNKRSSEGSIHGGGSRGKGRRALNFEAGDCGGT